MGTICMYISHCGVCLQESLGVPGDVAYTCETAGHFYLYQILSRWEQYVSKVKPLSKKVSRYAGTCIYVCVCAYM